MSSIAPQNAMKLAIWLAASHPRAFRAIAAKVATVNAQRAKGFSGGPFGALGLSIDDLQPVTLETDTTHEVFAPMADISFDSTALSTPNFDLGPGLSSVSDSSSGGFWSTLGSSIGSFASGTANVLGSVAQSLTSPQAIQAAGQIAATVIAADANRSQAAQQQAVLQAQLARVQAGQPPASIIYGTNSYGQQVPMYYNARTGQYQPTSPSLLSSLMPSGSSWVLPTAIVGAIVVVLGIAASKRR